MKPRIRIYDPKVPCIKFICSGDKDGRYHCAFGTTEEEAYKAWEESEPREMTEDDWADIPF